MDLRCPHCGEPVTAGMKVCPRCEADLREISTPKTIQELQQYCLLKNIPAEKMRFFIGEDYKEPKAFGIYQADDGRYVVYKNKADGTRAIRYEGYDEAYAVTEILQKMQSEVDLRYEKKQRSRTSAPDRKGSPQRKQTGKKTAQQAALKGCLITVIVTTLLMGFVVFAFWAFTREPDIGYYYYDDDYYYYLDDDWYRYEDDDWVPADEPEDLREDYEDYYVGYGYEDNFGVDTFYTTPYFQDYSERQSYSDYDDDDDDFDSWRWDDDDDDDWDWDDWDTDDTDWDSDW